MPTNTIFITLPVNDLEASRSFYTGLGYSVNALFSDENSTSILLADNITVMLVAKAFFATLTDRELIDPKNSVQALHALGVESRDEVDGLATKALAAGGTVGEPQDYGFMYARDVVDPDGHGWQITWLDPTASESESPESAA